MNMKVKGCKIIDIKKVIENDGTLLVVEDNNNPIPFDIHRLFWVRDVAEGSSRGDHATKKTKLILIPVHGQCKVRVDDGENEEIIVMDDASKGLYIEEMIWRSMFEFSKDCVMMAVADHVFEPGNETYDDYEEYLRAKKEQDGK